ncbi:ATP-NAD kinase-like domain-containing protein [Cladochytrium replicatum]|nr:ATP-NAD kinase-like domain-containing protein [Cladochytrium replicatum]
MQDSVQLRIPGSKEFVPAALTLNPFDISWSEEQHAHHKGYTGSFPLLFVFAITALHPGPNVPKTENEIGKELLRSSTSKPDDRNLRLLKEAVTLLHDSESDGPIGFIIHTILTPPKKKFSHIRPYYDPVVVLASANVVAKWILGVKNALRSFGEENRRRKLMILYNPFGGTNQAKHRCDNFVRPMLDLAGLEYDVQETQFPGHATEFAHTIDSSVYTDLICISGDGLLHEVIDGLLHREDWETTVQHIAVGYVGSGTSNGMARTLDVPFTEHATLAIIKGDTRKIDLFSAEVGNRVYYSHLTLTWGFIADCDIESETYRWVGSERTTVAALVRVANLRRYHGSLYAIPVDDSEIPSAYRPFQNSFKRRQSGGGSSNREAAIKAAADLEKARAKRDALAENGDDPIAKFERFGPVRAHASDDFTKYPIAIEEETFTTLTICKAPWPALDWLACKYARLSDGCMHVLASGVQSRQEILGDLLDRLTGNGPDLPHYSYFRAKAIYFFPTSRSEVKEAKRSKSLSRRLIKEEGAGGPPPVQRKASYAASINSTTSSNSSVLLPDRAELKEAHNHGIISLSGEHIPFGPIRMEIHPNLLKMVVPIWLDEDVNTSPNGGERTMADVAADWIKKCGGQP